MVVWCRSHKITHKFFISNVESGHKRYWTKIIVYIPLIVLGPVVPHQLSRYGLSIWILSENDPPRIYRSTTIVLYCSRRRPFCGHISDMNKSHKPHKQNGCRVLQRFKHPSKLYFVPFQLIWQMYCIAVSHSNQDHSFAFTIWAVAMDDTSHPLPL